MTDFATLVQDSIAEATTLLFSSFGLVLDSGEATPDTSFQLVAVIGFTGDQVRGTLGVTVSPEVLTKAFATFGQSDPDQRLLNDFVGEIANQLLGRVKNYWIPSGLDVQITTPIVLRGVSLTICGTEHPTFYERSWVMEGSLVSVWVDAQPAEGLILQPPTEQQAIQQGEVVLF